MYGNKIALFLMMIFCVFLFFGCTTVGLESTGILRPSHSPVPTTTLPVTTNITPSPTTTVPVLTTTVPVTTTTNSELPPETFPWEAEPIFDPKFPLSQMTEDTLKSIKLAYCEDAKEITVDEVSLRVFGVFQDTYVLLVDVSSYSYPTVIVSEMVDEYAFWYSSGHTMEVFHDGSFYSLQEAFDTDLLTTDDLQTVFDNYYGAYPYLWALYYEVGE